jgi:hypothetical protein
MTSKGAGSKTGFAAPIPLVPPTFITYILESAEHSNEEIQI